MAVFSKDGWNPYQYIVSTQHYYSIMQEAHMPYMAWEQGLTLHHKAPCGIW